MQVIEKLAWPMVSREAAVVVGASCAGQASPRCISFRLVRSLFLFLSLSSFVCVYRAVFPSSWFAIGERKRISPSCSVIRSAAYICGIYCHSVHARWPAHEGACLRRRVLPGIVEEIHCVPGSSVRHTTIRFPAHSRRTSRARTNDFTYTRTHDHVGSLGV